MQSYSSHHFYQGITLPIPFFSYKIDREGSDLCAISVTQSIDGTSESTVFKATTIKKAEAERKIKLAKMTWLRLYLNYFSHTMLKQMSLGACRKSKGRLLAFDRVFAMLNYLQKEYPATRLVTDDDLKKVYKHFLRMRPTIEKILVPDVHDEYEYWNGSLRAVYRFIRQQVTQPLKQSNYARS